MCDIVIALNNLINLMKNILLSTPGARPQLLTETLFAIHQSGQAFPDEVYVMITQKSYEPLVDGLFRKGHLQALKEEYQLPDFEFDESHILLIKDEQGNFIEDAKSAADQTAMATFITRKVYELTQDEDIAIHASLSGGRKTLGFYFGCAMSMFGREQDMLSHVFVDDQYEFVKDFWYPTKRPKWVADKFGHGFVDVSRASITLAEIPFIRLRGSIDTTLLVNMASVSLSKTMGLLKQKGSHAVITINKAARFISALGVEVKLTAKELAFYLWLLNKGHDGVVVNRNFERSKVHSIAFLKMYCEVGTDPRIFSTFNTTPEDFSQEDYKSLAGMGREFVQPVCSAINTKLKKTMPPQIFERLQIYSKSEAGEQRYQLKLSCCNGEVELD